MSSLLSPICACTTNVQLMDHLRHIWLTTGLWAPEAFPLFSVSHFLFSVFIVLHCIVCVSVEAAG